MSSFVSLMDVLNDNQPLAPIVNEVKDMKADVKAKMDAGLSTEEMKTAKGYYDAIVIAENILENISNK